MLAAVRLLRHQHTLRIEVTCACCAVTVLDVVLPYAVCACGADMEARFPRSRAESLEGASGKALAELVTIRPGATQRPVQARPAA